MAPDATLLVRVRALIALTGFAGMLAACFPASPTQNSTGEQSGVRKVLRIATLGGAPKLLHPYPEPQDNTSPLADALTLIQAGLIDLNADTLDYWAPRDYTLATEMPAISIDGRTFTFTLRDDIRWSDGRPITSADFQYAWDQASRTENNFVGLDDLDRIESFRTPDAQTIVVTLKQPMARYLALTTASI